MKTKVIQSTMPPLVFPVLMQSTTGCIKLFVNPADGILLAAEDGHPVTRLHISGDGEGRMVPATDDYWKPFTGTVTLSN